jgi:CO dehydrogenase/acetyl-CoA synthase epsilon subunit
LVTALVRAVAITSLLKDRPWNGLRGDVDMQVDFLIKVIGRSSALERERT